MKNLIIALSGGCFSGKTTTMEKLKEYFGDKIVIAKELIRERLDDEHKTIDEIRKEPKLYFETQKKIILNKANYESDIIKNNDSKIIVLDRAFSDSLFYYIFYIDKAFFNDNMWQEYLEFLKWLIKYAEDMFDTYDLTIEFEPINKKCEDVKYRPVYIQHIKYIENILINLINKGLNRKRNIIYVDLNTTSVNYLINVIENLYEPYL